MPVDGQKDDAKGALSDFLDQSIPSLANVLGILLRLAMCVDDDYSALLAIAGLIGVGIGVVDWCR